MGRGTMMRKKEAGARAVRDMQSHDNGQLDDDDNGNDATKSLRSNIVSESSYPSSLHVLHDTANT